MNARQKILDVQQEIEAKKDILIDAYNRYEKWSRVVLLVPKIKETFDMFVSQVLNDRISEKIYPISLCDDFLTNTSQLLLLFRMDNAGSQRTYSSFQLLQNLGA